jgi:hypothetical protein
MTNTKFRALIALSAMMGLAAAQAPRARADLLQEEEFGNVQCWYRVGIDSPQTCYECHDKCMGGGYVCCMGGGAQ